MFSRYVIETDKQRIEKQSKRLEKKFSHRRRYDREINVNCEDLNSYHENANGRRRKRDHSNDRSIPAI